jgi:hypothetical protein
MILVSAAVAAVAISASGNGGKPIAAAEAVAFIRAVELQPNDLPRGFPYEGEPGSPPESAEFQHLLHCGHRGKPRGWTVAAERSVLADRYRDWIGELVASVVIVMPTEVLANAEIAALRSRSGRDCMERDLRVSALGSGGPAAPIYAVSLTSDPFARVLGHNAVVLRLLARFQRSRHIRSHHGATEPRPKLLYSVEAIFRVGAADIVFYVLSEHRQFPQSIERHLLTLLYDRANAHKL